MPGIHVVRETEANLPSSDRRPTHEGFMSWVQPLATVRQAITVVNARPGPEAAAAAIMCHIV